MERDLLVAAVSLNCPGGQPGTVRLKIHRMIDSLSAQGVELLCFPEACITGYSVRPQEAMSWAIPLENPWVEQLREASAQRGITLLVGMMEKAPQGGLFLTHLAICPDGALVVYRKAHLSPQEASLFQPGNTMGIFRAGPALGAMALCYEAHFPEWATALTLEGAEILCFPSASPGESPQGKMERWLRFLPARAYDNGAFVLACNQAGENGSGLHFPAVALILDPKGRVLAAECGEDEAVAVASLRTREINRVRTHPLAHFLRHRRPELYRNSEELRVKNEE
jgi:predicted amidohydrolase